MQRGQSSMQLWHSIWQMLKKCHTTRSQKPLSIWEVHQSRGSADICRCNLNSFRSIQFRQAAQHNAMSESHCHSSHCSSNPKHKWATNGRGETQKEGTSYRRQKTEVRVHTSLATAVEQHLHTQRGSTPPEMHFATSVGRRDNSKVVAG